MNHYSEIFHASSNTWSLPSPAWMERAALVALGISAGFIFFAFISGFEGIKRGKDEHDQWQPTTCLAINVSTTLSRCCVIDACSCSECSVLSVVCTALESQSLNQSTCCGDPACCQDRCTSTCSHQICSGTGSSRSCYASTYCCQKDCAVGVSHQTCGFRCGTCADMSATFRVAATNNVQQGVAQRCGMNDLQCRTNYLDLYGHDFDCVYNPRNPTDVRLSRPGYSSGYKAGIAFVVICGFGAIVSFACFVYIYCTSKTTPTPSPRFDIDAVVKAAKAAKSVTNPPKYEHITPSAPPTTISYPQKPSAPPPSTEMDPPPPYDAEPALYS